MGLYFRKSVSLGGGLRLNFSKRGVGISGGVKGARISKGPSGTYMNLSIPGTGIYYRKKLSGSNSSYRSNTTTTTNRYPYYRTIVNDYTGEQRTVRAASQWELDEMVRNEELRMQTNELRARRNAQIASQKEKADELTKQAKQVQNSLKTIISATIKVNDRLDWDKQYITETYPEFKYTEQPPKKKRISILDKIKGKADDLDDRMTEYENKKKQALQEYIKAKDEFETEKREHNADVSFLRENFECAEESAIEKYASVVLANSKYPAELEMDFDVDYIPSEDMIKVSFLFPNIDEFPTIDRYSYNQSSDEIKEYQLPKSDMTNLYENTLLSVGIRTIHELFEAIYIDAVEKVEFTGYLLSSEATDEIVDFSDNVTKLFKISANRDIFEKISLSDDNINNVLQQLSFERTGKFI